VTRLLNKEFGNMDNPKIETESYTIAPWEIEINRSEEIPKRLETAFSVAFGKLLDTQGDIESVLQTGEAFGRGLFTEFVQKKPHDWDIKEWLDVTIENLFSPMGTSFILAELGLDKARTVMTQCDLHGKSDEPYVASLFTYGCMRGMLLSAFPKGELIMGKSIDVGSPMTEFTFKTIASYNDRFERQRVKNLFKTPKKL
jgi:hypothetical protein